MVFKRDDMIECINNCDHTQYLTVGKHYRVIDSHDSNFTVYIKPDKGENLYFAACRFKLVDPTPQFKKGDLVECIDVESLSCLKLHQICTVEQDSPNSDSVMPVNINGNVVGIWLSKSRFKKVEKTMETKEDETEPKKNLLKVGDKIKLVKNYGNINPGVISEVLEISGSNCIKTIISEDNKPSWYFADHFELYDSTAPKQPEIVPEGWKLTGEFRVPNVGEHYAGMSDTIPTPSYIHGAIQYTSLPPIKKIYDGKRFILIKEEIKEEVVDNTPKIEVQPGKSYITADGHIVTPLNCLDRCGRSFRVWSNFHSRLISFCWEKDGSLEGVPAPCKLDLKLVEEVTFNLPKPEEIPRGYKLKENGLFRVPIEGDSYLPIKKVVDNVCFYTTKALMNGFSPYNLIFGGKRFILEKLPEEEIKKSQIPSNIVIITDPNHVLRTCDYVRHKKGNWQQVDLLIGQCVGKYKSMPNFEFSCCEKDFPGVVSSTPTTVSNDNVKEEEMKKETAVAVTKAVGKFAGTWGFRALNYWVFEPAAGIGRPILKSVRYAVFVSMLGAGIYGYRNPEVVTNAIKSCLPKISIEAPSILGGDTEEV